MSSSRSEYYRSMLSIGEEYEKFIVAELQRRGVTVARHEGRRDQLDHGDTTIGLEIKFDRKFHHTGNLAIETAASVAEGLALRPEGIYRDDTSRWYGIGNYVQFFVFTKTRLREIDRVANLVRYVTPRPPRLPTSRGFLMPKIMAEVHAERTLTWPMHQPLERP